MPLLDSWAWQCIAVTGLVSIGCAGMLTQHKVQLDLREKNPNLVRPPANPYVVGPQHDLDERVTSAAAVYPRCIFL